MLVFVEGGKLENQEKTLGARREPTTNSVNPRLSPGRNRIRVILEGGERSHNCDIPTPLIFLHRAKLLFISDFFNTALFLMTILVSFSYLCQFIRDLQIRVHLVLKLSNIAFHTNLSPIGSFSIAQKLRRERNLDWNRKPTLTPSRTANAI